MRSAEGGVGLVCIHGPCRPPQPVVDGLAKALVRDRHDGDGVGTRGIERAQRGEQVGGGLDEIA